MNRNNTILKTDSYKLTHWNQYQPDTEVVYSYFESRAGAKFPYTTFFGLQAILVDHLVGVRVTQEDIEQAAVLAEAHFGNGALFNRAGWQHILDAHGGMLPLRIKAVAEGTSVPTGNVLMSVENTDPACYWLTNAVESLLTHVWYPSTVATLSRTTQEIIAGFLAATAESMDGLPFMLHDFGYRGATVHEAGEIGGAAHLVNFMGTDTLPAMLLLLDLYGADLATLAFSVPATEHSVMTALGEHGEETIVGQLLDNHPTGILSVVADSYNIYDLVESLGTRFKDRILERDGTFVVRPDSTTDRHPYPSALVAWILDSLWGSFGGETNAKGFRVLDSHVRVLWGDGLDPHAIEMILGAAQVAGYSAENLVFGMGGGLLQKGIDRDTQKFAFKCSAQRRDGTWYDIFKDPVGGTKRSKKGRLKLVVMDGQMRTLKDVEGDDVGLLKVVFENGRLVGEQTFDAIRERAALTGAVTPTVATATA